jgi:1-acyl-sn-glycerol-3-phosphate acyltransferase
VTETAERDSGKTVQRIEYSIGSRIFYSFVRALVRIIIVVLFRLKVRGLENEPKSGRVIFAANHIAVLDPPVVAVSVGRPLTFLAKKELFRIPIFSSVISALHATPVDRAGYSRGVLEKLRAILESDQGAVIFPEGTRQRDGKLGEGKIGVGMLAVWTQAPVIPVYLSGSNDLIGSLLFKHRIKVALGEPVIPPAVSGAAERKEAYQSVTDQVMERMAELKLEVDSA